MLEQLKKIQLTCTNKNGSLYRRIEMIKTMLASEVNSPHAQI